jgi:hypothetical protein
MSKLDTQERNSLPKKEFGLPNERKYPMPDREHAINAKARATQMHDKGLLSLRAEELIDAKANRILNNK